MKTNLACVTQNVCEDLKCTLRHSKSIVQLLLATFQSSTIDFCLLFWFERCLISAPAFVRRSACRRSRFTRSQKVRHKPHYHTSIGRSDSFSCRISLINTTAEQRQVMMCQVTAASREALLRWSYKSEAELNGKSTFVSFQNFSIQF